MTPHDPLRLWWSPDSANLVVRIALHEFGLPYEARLVDRAAGGLRDPAFLALNPQGLLPVLEEGGRIWFETAAILIRLTEIAGRLGPEGPPADDPQARAGALRWLLFLSNTLHADLRIQFYAPRWVTDEAAVPALRAGVRRRILAHLALIDAELARAGGWLAGAGPTVADLYLGVLARWARIHPPGLGVDGAAIDALPRLSALLGALETRPALRAACAAEGIVEPRPLAAPVVPTPAEGSVYG
jgi:glutathione S-transferase